MRLDLNAFFGQWQFWPLRHPAPDDVLRLMDRHGIDRAAIASLRGLYGERRAANAETLAAAGAHPDRFIPVAVISPMRPRAEEPPGAQRPGGRSAQEAPALSAAAEVRSLAEQGFRALRLYPLLHGYRLHDPFADEVCEAAAERRLPVIVCTRPMMNFRFATVPIEEVGALAGRHPKTPFILSGPNYLTESRAAVLVMGQCPNVAIEITCMQGMDALGRMVETVGPDRVLFGTGMPLHYPACNVAKLVHARVPESVREAVGGGNAKSLLCL